MPYPLQKRNVEVYNPRGAIIAGFWQCGTLRWDEFYRYLAAFIFADTSWTIFCHDPAQDQHGAHCPPVAQAVQPGHYTVLSDAGEPIRIGVEFPRLRPRNPTMSSTPTRESHYRRRGRDRDGKCLITGLQSQTYSRLKVAHIFPRAHDREWKRKGYPSKIADTADEAAMGGPSKIDSIQNVITLRNDLHDAWINYEFGVNPDDDYRITAFTNGNADINGLRLQLDHIQDPTIRPLDELLADHFMQGIFKHMRGESEPAWTYEDYDDAFGEGSFNMSNPKIWGTREGKERFELALADRLFDHRVQQEHAGA